VTLADAEREHILGALRETGWVVAGPKGATTRLGMKRSTLQEKMRKLGISRPHCGGPQAAPGAKVQKAA
jgi:formate hydrogenlyase transcriptional activator